jgi:hypothetical protein
MYKYFNEKQNIINNNKNKKKKLKEKKKKKIKKQKILYNFDATKCANLFIQNII